MSLRIVRSIFRQPASRWAAGLLAGSLWLVVPALAQEAANAKLVTFDPPGSLKTIPFSINVSKSVTGYYYDGVANHGFVRNGRSGAIATFDAGGQGVYTFPYSINDGGAIAGYTNQTDGYVHSFVRDAQGAITTFDPPGAVFGSEAWSINQDGTTAGLYQDATGVHGYVRDAQGIFTSFDVPGSTYTEFRGWLPGHTVRGSPAHLDRSGIAVAIDEIVVWVVDPREGSRLAARLGRENPPVLQADPTRRCLVARIRNSGHNGYEAALGEDDEVAGQFTISTGNHDGPQRRRVAEGVARPLRRGQHLFF